MPLQEREREIVATVFDRSELIDRLLDGPKEKRELVEELPVSRSTVNRAIRELETLELVERVDEGYRVTDLCRSTTTRLSALVDSVGYEMRLQKFRKWVPDGTLEFDLADADDATVLLPEPGNPYGMVNRHVERLREAPSHRSVLPLTGLHGYEAVHDRVVEAGVETTVVAAPSVVDVLVTDPEFEPLTDALTETDRFRLFETEEPVPYFVGVYGDVVQFGVDDDGDPRALYETTDTTVREWANRRIDDYVERAERVL
ncbi:helix-turn-helix transcriptional regulator [Halobium salinum]|uniref:Helix-turn-helix transcriptional regulator n=1 Tax=Halobium salinum TaxID=1364940 RepID=A0ABD5PG74_9EURY|nr:GntR family transcriptional regulator [Halobium salinum]